MIVSVAPTVTTVPLSVSYDGEALLLEVSCDMPTVLLNVTPGSQDFQARQDIVALSDRVTILENENHVETINLNW